MSADWFFFGLRDFPVRDALSIQTHHAHVWYAGAKGQLVYAGRLYEQSDLNRWTRWARVVHWYASLLECLRYGTRGPSLRAVRWLPFVCLKWIKWKFTKHVFEIFQIKKINTIWVQRQNVHQHFKRVKVYIHRPRSSIIWCMLGYDKHFNQIILSVTAHAWCLDLSRYIFSILYVFTLYMFKSKMTYIYSACSIYILRHRANRVPHLFSWRGNGGRKTGVDACARGVEYKPHKWPNFPVVCVVYFMDFPQNNNISCITVKGEWVTYFFTLIAWWCDAWRVENTSRRQQSYILNDRTYEGRSSAIYI